MHFALHYALAINNALRYNGVMRASTYSRVSTSDKGQNPEVQADELRRYCLARGWGLVEDIKDHGFSGGTDKRPGLKRLLELARSREIDVIIVVKLDRLARSLRHLLTLLDEFKTLGITFISVRDQIDFGTANGRLMLHLMAAFSEFERSLIRERTLAGLEYSRRHGRTLGRPKTRDDQAILKLRADGASYSQIEKLLGVSRPSISRAIKSGSTKSPTETNLKKSVKTGCKNG